MGMLQELTGLPSGTVPGTPISRVIGFESQLSIKGHMQPETELHDAAGRYRRRIIWLTIPPLLTVAVELLGGWRYGKDYSGKYAIHLGFLYPLIYLMFALSIVGPLWVYKAFQTVFSHWNTLRVQKGWLSALLLLLTITLLLSMFSCAWSCSGHPTWTSGYN